MLGAGVMLAALAAAMGQTMPGTEGPKPICCFDKTFSAVIGEIGARFNDEKEALIDGVSVIGYDLYNKHSASETYIRGPNNTTIKVFELKDFTTNTHYKKMGNGTCEKTPLKRGYMFPPCIPGNATHVTDSTLGYSGVGQTLHDHHRHNHTHTFNQTKWQEWISGNHSFEFNRTRHHHSRLGLQFYEFEVPTVGNTGGRIKLGVTERNCIPVIEFFTGQVNGTFVELNMFFTSYHPGIEHMEVFDLPNDCT